MKIQCDVCNKKEALIFCCADEAALCHGCDEGVHHANKLASKHQRFSLLNPSPSLSPLCDICQEKKALIFCQEDRAILCRDCEVSIHTGNELTKKHNRFLLTGIKLSSDCDPLPTFDPSTKPTCEISSSNDKAVSGGSTSSVSEYLIETIPGWHFEDIEDASFDFSQSGSMDDFEVDKDVLSFWDGDIDKKMSSYWWTTNPSTQSENLGIWVPQAPSAASAAPASASASASAIYSQKQQQQETSANGFTKKWNKKNDVLTVPQMTNTKSHVTSSKRPRTLW